ncbi:hypothetical protein KY329_00665 [Candidatus Woesearchaeota archaeon]|nr:hypothetical protein [Candidatus Woesearchaeota archaeon]
MTPVQEILWKIATIVVPTLMLLGIIYLFYKWIERKNRNLPVDKKQEKR